MKVSNSSLLGNKTWPRVAAAGPSASPESEAVTRELGYTETFKTPRIASSLAFLCTYWWALCKFISCHQLNVQVFTLRLSSRFNQSLQNLAEEKRRR